MSGSIVITFTAPPNLITARCCGSCKHSEHQYEGEIICSKYPEYVTGPNVNHNIHDGVHQWEICDDFEPEVSQ